MTRIGIVLIVYVLSSLATLYHHQEYLKALNVAKLKGTLVSTGKKKSYLAKGSIAIIACDDFGNINHGEILEGRTIFAKFKPINGIQGMTTTQAKLKFKDKFPIIQAIGFLEEKAATKNY